MSDKPEPIELDAETAAAVAHTPGPWVAADDGSTYYNGPDDCPSGPWSIRDAYNGMVLAVIIPDCVDEVAANARLIAAAPELLQALRRILTHVNALEMAAVLATHYPVGFANMEDAVTAGLAALGKASAELAALAQASAK